MGDGQTLKEEIVETKTSRGCGPIQCLRWGPRRPTLIAQKAPHKERGQRKNGDKV